MSTTNPGASAPHGRAFRPTVMGRRGCVAAAHPLAAMAGIEIMLQGGSAIDAALATSFALHVVEPYMSSPGGVATLLVVHRGRREAVVSAGRMPAAADPSRVAAEDLKAGPRSIGVPGLVAATLGLHERYGTVPRTAAMAPAIRLAEDGFPLTVKNVEFIRKARPQLAHSPEAERTFLVGGEVPRAGTVLAQKDLGATLRQIAEGGVDAFYRGPIARAIARAMEAQHGWITEADLAAYRPTWGTPLAVGFRGHEVCVPPPPTNALQSVQTLHLLEGFDLKSMGHNSIEYLHHFIEAAKVASADRVGLDVLHPDAPIAGLISPRYAAHRRTLDRSPEGRRLRRRAMERGAPPRRDPPRPPGGLREGAHHALRGRRRRRHGGHRDADAREPVRLGRDGPGHRHASEQPPDVGGRRAREPGRPPRRRAHADAHGADPGLSRRDVPPVDRHAGLLRHPPDDAADAAERGRVRDDRAGGDRGAARPRVPGPPGRRRGAHPGARARTAWRRAATRST